MVGRQNYCAGTAKLLHTILPFNGTEKTMMIHYNDEALFREFVAKGKAYGEGTYDFTFEDRYIIYHVKDVALRYIALDKETGLASEVEYLTKSSKLYTKTTYYKLFARILYSIKYNGDTRYISTERMVMTPSETIDFIFRQVMPYHGYAVREEQIKLAHSMYEGFKTGRVSINEAEVGTGKSMAYLVAGFVARQASSARNRFPVTIATSSIELQRAIVEKEIPNLSKMLQKFGIIHRPLTVSLRKGKEHYLCQRRYEEYYEQIAKFKKYQRTIEKFEALNDTEGLVDLDTFDLRPSIKDKICVKGSCRKCKYRYDCGYAAYVDKSKSCDFDYQVTNHNMFLTALKGGEDPNRPTRNILCPSWLVVIDEAHKLKNAAEDVFGVRFDEEAVQDYVKAVKTMKREYTDARDFKIALNDLLKANDSLFSALREKTKEDDYENGRNTLIKLTPILEEYLYELEENIGHVECMREEPENAPSLNIELVRDTIMTMLDDDEMNYWIEEDDNGILSLCASPKNIATEMFKKIWDTHKSFVLTSGTMSDGSSFDYFKQENGIDRVPSNLIRTSTTESPFDYKNHARLYIPGDMPQPDNQSEEYRQALADKIVELVKATHGHTAILFTSYSVLRSVYEMTKDRLADFNLICMTRSNKSAIADFKKSKNAVLFASGSMWEGVDCAGDGLSSVIITRLPFPLRSALMEQKKDKCSSVPEFVQKYAVPEMIIKLRQGVGRLIRTETDTGLVSILDSRAYSGANAVKVQHVLKKYTRVRSMDKIEEFFHEIKPKEYFEGGSK